MAEMENATSETHDLRAILDERGVEYETNDVQVSDTEWCYVTKLRDGYNDRWTYEELPGTDLLVSYQYDLDAEDAVAATLGPKMTATDGLLPCPFCGGEAQRDSNNAHNGDIMDDFRWFAVYCPTCGCASTPPFDTPSEAIAAWNRRVKP